LTNKCKKPDLGQRVPEPRLAHLPNRIASSFAAAFSSQTVRPRTKVPHRPRRAEYLVLSRKRVFERGTLNRVALTGSGRNACTGGLVVSLPSWLVPPGPSRGAIRAANRPNRPQNTRLRHPTRIRVEEAPNGLDQPGRPRYVTDDGTQAPQCLSGRRGLRDRDLAAHRSGFGHLTVPPMRLDSGFPLAQGERT
jgi:hypothetical protein